MSYNLSHEHNEDVHPEGKAVHVDFVIVKEKIIAQSSNGFNENLELDSSIEAPFNTSSFIHHDKYYCQITKLTNEPTESVITQFCSPMTHSKYKLPQALIRACDFVCFEYPDDGVFLKNALLSDYGIDILDKGGQCWITCVEKAQLLYQVAFIEDDHSYSPEESFDGEGFESLKVASNDSNFAHLFNQDFGRMNSIASEEHIDQGENNFIQNQQGIKYEYKEEVIHIPITVHCFTKESRIFILLSELMVDKEERSIVQFSSLIGTDEQSAIQQANTYISYRYGNYSLMLLHVLSVISDKALVTYNETQLI